MVDDMEVIAEGLKPWLPPKLLEPLPPPAPSAVVCEMADDVGTLTARLRADLARVRSARAEVAIAVSALQAELRVLSSMQLRLGNALAAVEGFVHFVQQRR